MKYLYTIISLIISLGISTNTNAQSISASKIINYLDSQKQSEISSDLLRLGFVLTEKKETAMFTGRAYTKKSGYGIESLNLAVNDELFSIIYKPATSDIYSAIKEKMLTKDFIYSYSYQVTKYYESSNMRIGINDTSKTISFFVTLK